MSFETYLVKNESSGERPVGKKWFVLEGCPCASAEPPLTHPRRGLRMGQVKAVKLTFYTRHVLVPAWLRDTSRWTHRRRGRWRVMRRRDLLRHRGRGPPLGTFGG